VKKLKPNEGIERLVFCCGYQDKIVIRTIITSGGIGHTVKIGEVKPSKCDDVDHLLRRIAKITRGHTGDISHSVEGPVQNRRDAETRRAQLINAGLTVATTLGWRYVSKNTVGTIARVSPNTVQYHFGTMEVFKNAVMARAIARGMHDIVAAGILDENEVALSAPRQIRREALMLLHDVVMG